MGLQTNHSSKAKRDIELVNRARSGDQKAYTELLSHYRDAIFFMIKKMVKNDDDAEDLTIEAFGKAFKMLKHYKGSYAFSTWLFKIASNHCIDFIRKQKKHTLLSIDESNENDSLPNQYIISKVPDPEEEMIWRQKAKLLKNFIGKLHPDYQEIIKMKYFHGLSYIEIAEELEIPMGTVKARLFRSKELLQSIMKGKDI